MYYAPLLNELNEIKEAVLRELTAEPSHAIPIGHFYHRLKNYEQAKISTAVWMLVSDRKVRQRKEDNWFVLVPAVPEKKKRNKRIKNAG